MLNFVYWPISFVLWVWHKVFAVPFGADSALSWILAIVFLTFTVRLLLLKPTIAQMRSSRKMQEMQPHIQALKEKYKNNQQKQMEEMRKLQKEMGVNPLAGCLPVFIQLPVFLGLFHVLRSFNRTGTGHGMLGMSVEQNRNTPNYFFSPQDVQSFLDANLFGVPLSAYISMPAKAYEAFTVDDLSKAKIAIVAVPLILITVFATHFNAKMAISRQQARVASGKAKAPGNDMMATQMDMMNKMMVWILPGSLLITGVFWHIGLLFYMMANNIWTFFQQRWLFNKMDAEEEAEIAAKREAKRATAPRPGQRPNKQKKKRNT